MRKQITLAVAIGCLSAGALVPSAFAHEKKYTIGLAAANLQADFFNFIKESAEEEGDRLGYEIIVADSGGDDAKQLSQIQDFATQGVDGLILLIAGHSDGSAQLRIAQEAGIAVVCVDRNTTPACPTFIASDSEQAAYDLGKYVAKVTGGKGVVGVVQGQIGTTPEIARDTGFEKAMDEHPGLSTVEKQASKGWHMDEGVAIGQDLLQRNPDISVLFGRADALAMGASQAVKLANLDHDVLVVGFDGDREGLIAVRDGRLDATMTQQSKLMGRLAVRFVVDHIENRFVPEEMLLDATLTTKDNVETFIKVHP